MKIRIASATGNGKTLLSAYDAALINVGINNNLIILSSVIPKGGSVEQVQSVKDYAGQVGDRLYIVQAQIRSDKQEEVISSALGWYFLSDGTGTLVEHEVKGTDEKVVEAKLRSVVKSSIQDICEYRGERFSEEKMGIDLSICKVERQPACALTVAVFKSEPW